MIKIKQSQHSSVLAKGRLKKMIQHQPTVSRTLTLPPRHSDPHFLMTRVKLIGGFFTLILIFGGLVTYLHLFPTLLPTQESGANATNQATAQYQIPMPTPPSQQQPSISIPSLPQQQSPVSSPPVVPPVLPAERSLYSTAHSSSVCDTQGGYRTDTSDTSVTCNPDGSKTANTLGQPAIANSSQLGGGDQFPWSGKNFILQLQATLNQHSHQAFGIKFQPEAKRGFLHKHFLQNLLKGPADLSFR